MTTIAYRDGVMAADSRAYSGDKVPVGTKTKIRRLADGTLIGCSSNRPGQPEAVMTWWENGRLADTRPTFEPSIRFLAVHPNGDAYVAYDSLLFAGPMRGEYFAVGSGEEYALGALAMGATAEEAVKVGIRLDPWSGGPVTVLRHEG